MSVKEGHYCEQGFFLFLWQAFFHFFYFASKWIFRILEFRKKILEF